MTNESQRLAEGSTLVRFASDRLRRWAAASWLAAAIASIETGLDAARDASLLARVARLLARYVRHSSLYRWLTKEPEPDVIVIDLRETYAVGPVIALLDRLAPVLARTWRGSHARRVADRIRTGSVWTWAAESRTVRLLAAALEPPEPPEEAYKGRSDEDDHQ